MKLAYELSNRDRFYEVEEVNSALLIIFFFRENNIITDAKMQGMFISLRKGDLLKHRDVYHSNINDKWYNNNESMFDILDDIWTDASFKLGKDLIRSIELENMLKYLNLYLNKNRNYCIDYLFLSYVKPIIDVYGRYTGYYDNSDDLQLYLKLFNLEVPTLNTVTYDNFEPFGYCCDDCDGDYYQYKTSQYHNRVVFDNRRALQEYLVDYFNNLKRYKQNYKPMYSTIEF